MSSYEKFLWIELIGFDNSAADFGVSEFLSRMKKKPSLLSLLLWSAEIVHAHNGIGTDALLGPRQCSYYARPYNEERKRQDWTKFQLRGLIAELQKHGVAVYMSIFDQIMSKNYAKEHGLPETAEWTDSHDEVFYVTRDGEKMSNICPWKHLKDGSLYEDFFIKQLSCVLNDYGFDGFHAADGYGHPRMPLCQADFSDDTVEQFSVHQGIAVPGNSIPKRAAWILKNVQEQWITFHTKRHGKLIGKLLAMLHGIHKKHVFNTTWTRDPFEAQIRYGIDYRILADAGVKEFVVEAQAAVVELEGWNRSKAPMLDQYRAMTIRLKAQIPECKLYLLNCVKDGMEQYSALRHAPTRMESDIYSVMNLFYNGKRCLEGVMTCLSDGIKPWEWRTIDSTYDKAFDGTPHTFPFGTVLWSDEAHKKEVSAYVKHPVCSSFRLFYRLLSAGAVLGAGASATEPHALNGTVILLNPAYWEKEELAGIIRKAKGKVLLIGLDTDHSFACRVLEQGRLLAETMSELTTDKGDMPFSWLSELPERMPSDEFLSKCADFINTHASDIRPTQEPHTVRLWGFYRNTGSLRLFIGNEKTIYNHGKISLKGNFLTAQPLTDDPAFPPTLSSDGDRTLLSLKLPPSGTVIIDLEESGNPISS